MDMAGVLNEYFSSVFTREDIATIPEARVEHEGAEMHDVRVTTRKV